MSKEAMKLALESLRKVMHVYQGMNMPYVVESVIALESALAKQEQGEPVAWWIPKAEQFCLQNPSGERPFAKAWEPLYTTPQQRTWVGLTYEQENKAAMKLAECMDYPWTLMPKEGKQKMRVYAKEIIEAAHGIKEKNT